MNFRDNSVKRIGPDLQLLPTSNLQTQLRTFNIPITYSIIENTI